MPVIVVKPAGSLKGEITLPGDKSISHRALFISGLAEGESTVEGFQESDDCLSTLKALLSYGIEIKKEGSTVFVSGKGKSGFQEPSEIIDCRNSGTTMRLISGIAAGLPFTTFLTGDQSLKRRPMARIAEPLRLMGATVLTRSNGLPPLAITGGSLFGMEYRMPVASAQVKSCLLLAGLFASGMTTIIEPAQTRDHTERMLSYFGATLKYSSSLPIPSPPAGESLFRSSPLAGEVGWGGKSISILGGQRLSGRQIKVPGDFSAAAYFLAAGSIVPNAEILIKDVGINPTRTAFLDVLLKMGARIILQNRREENGEPVGDILVKSSGGLKGVTVSGSLIPNLIDELPLLAVAGLSAEGKTEVNDAAELRVKESDRIAATVSELRRMGAEIEEKKDGFVLFGPQKLKGERVHSHLDHRIAMSLTIAALAAEGNTQVEEFGCVNVSFPQFFRTLYQLAY